MAVPKKPSKRPLPFSEKQPEVSAQSKTSPQNLSEKPEVSSPNLQAALKKLNLPIAAPLASAIPNLTRFTASDLQASQDFLTGKSGSSGETGEETIDGEVLQPPMTSDQFTEFWCFDLWDGIADLSRMAPMIPDLDAVRTPQDARPQAVKAGQALERLTYKYKFLEWMRSPYFEMSADMAAMAMFFGFKFRIIAETVRGGAGSPGGSAAPARPETQDPDLPEGFTDISKESEAA